MLDGGEDERGPEGGALAAVEGREGPEVLDVQPPGEGVAPRLGEAGHIDDIDDDGGEDGLVFYRRLAERTCEFLRDGGRAFWEIGYDQGETVAQIAAKCGLKVIEVRKDLSGHDRVVIVEKE